LIRCTLLLLLLASAGYNMQPDLYLGYGKTMNMEPMYTFEYPAEWVEDDVTKTEKSTMVRPHRHGTSSTQYKPGH
jgi:hypothetical protein